jgi:hypothetical protein
MHWAVPNAVPSIVRRVFVHDSLAVSADYMTDLRSSSAPSEHMKLHLADSYAMALEGSVGLASMMSDVATAAVGNETAESVRDGHPTDVPKM